MSERPTTKHDIQRDELNTIRPNFSEVTRVFVTGSIGMVYSGVDLGTGDITLFVTGSSGATGREILTSARTYYVSTVGNDSNSGLATGTSFLTIQKAIDVVATLDTATYNVTIQIADGTYVSNDLVCKNPAGVGTVTIQGNSGTPANVVVDGGFTKTTPGTAYTVKDLKLTKSASSSTSALYTLNGGYIDFTNINISTGFADQIYADVNGVIVCNGSYTISGGASRHLRATQGGTIRNVPSLTCTVSGTPAFSVNFATASQVALIRWASVTFSGSATGTRYDVALNSVINTGGGGANYFPGNAAGAAATGGQYA